MKPAKTALLLLLLSTLFPACGKDRPPVQRAVYHWESTFDLSGEERQWLDRNAVGRIYLRLFDIDLDEGLQEPVPVGVLQVPGTPPGDGREIVPVFFITNRTFAGLSETQTDTLAMRVLRKARTKLAEQLNDPPVPEWQFDCDWTGETREAYFRFLRAIRAALKTEGAGLSVTIRLHQVKYHERTGTPPADRGMLMFYNMDDVEDTATSNSILDLSVARGYYRNFDSYPLPLDLALPVFRWGVLFREGKMIRLINGLGTEDLQDTARFVFRDASHAEVVKSTYLDGYYLYAGDEIRLERATAGMLREAMRDLKKVLAKPPGWICLYQLAPETIKQYSDEDLVEIWNSFGP